MNPVTAAAGTQSGAVGQAIMVSITAFTIVFAVLIGLTGVIYAIKIFSGGKEKSKPSEAKSVVLPKQGPSDAVSFPAEEPRTEGAEGKKVVAAITAAILAATEGRGKVLSITPAGAEEVSSWTRIWRTSGIVERVSSGLRRSWKD